jgi:hypothetical protein
MEYSKKLEELKRKVTDTAKNLDEKYDITGKVDRGAKKASDKLRRGTEVAAAGIDAARREIERIDDEYDVSGKVKKSTEQVVGTVREGAKAAGEKTDELLGEAEKYYDRAEQVTKATQKAAQAGASLKSNFDKAKEWIKKNPGKTAVVGISIIAGTRMGSAFPGLDAVVLGAGSQGHWLFHSALAAYGLRKVSEKYFDYLKKQERLIQAGQLNEAEAARVEFQRNVAKYVGAPLLGAFSLATGATLIAESLSPGRIVGAPIELILGGNPILSSIWLFSNGVICIHNGYKFFMMAIADEEVVKRVVREAKYLLPA